jgi:hypothetical protein
VPDWYTQGRLPPGMAGISEASDSRCSSDSEGSSPAALQSLDSFEIVQVSASGGLPDALWSCVIIEMDWIHLVLFEMKIGYLDLVWQP